MTRKQPSRILHTGQTFKGRLRQIANLRDYTHHYPETNRSFRTPAYPKHRRQRTYRGNPTGDIGQGALDRFAGADGRNQLYATEGAPDEVGARVTGDYGG